jgi:hypothetical protein
MSSQKDPITNIDEQEFRAWSWEALGKNGPAYPAATAVKHAKTALEYYAKLPEPRKKANAALKKEVDDFIAAHP